MGTMSQSLPIHLPLQAAAARVAAAQAAQLSRAAAAAAAELVAWDLRLLRQAIGSGAIAGTAAAEVARTLLELLTLPGATVPGSVPRSALDAVKACHSTCRLCLHVLWRAVGRIAVPGVSDAAICHTTASAEYVGCLWSDSWGVDCRHHLGNASPSTGNIFDRKRLFLQIAMCKSTECLFAVTLGSAAFVGGSKVSKD